MHNPDYIKLLDIKKEALEAEKRIREHIRETHTEKQELDSKIFSRWLI